MPRSIRLLWNQMLPWAQDRPMRNAPQILGCPQQLGWPLRASSDTAVSNDKTWMLTSLGFSTTPHPLLCKKHHSGPRCKKSPSSKPISQGWTPTMKPAQGFENSEDYHQKGFLALKGQRFKHMQALRSKFMDSKRIPSCKVRWYPWFQSSVTCYNASIKYCIVFQWCTSQKMTGLPLMENQ